VPAVLVWVLMRPCGVSPFGGLSLCGCVGVLGAVGVVGSGVGVGRGAPCHRRSGLVTGRGGGAGENAGMSSVSRVGNPRAG
jgi:hypothetical protein